MVPYGDDGLPWRTACYRAEYRPGQSDYWYVNEMRSAALKLLQKSGLPAQRRGGSKSTLVSFSATDNYKDFLTSSIEQVSTPDLFGYYEKFRGFKRW